MRRLHLPDGGCAASQAWQMSGVTLTVVLGLLAVCDVEAVGSAIVSSATVGALVRMLIVACSCAVYSLSWSSAATTSMSPM